MIKMRHEEAVGHNDRPWVYFMIDAFFLCTQFFVITFHVKVDEAVLPQRLPPGSIHKPGELPIQPRLAENRVRIHVARVNGAPVYECMGQTGTLADSEAALLRAKSLGQECIVQMSYEPTVPYGDVMAVFNVCNKLDIKKCGLVPLRGADAAPGS
jgi:hypothetical protein